MVIASSGAVPFCLREERALAAPLIGDPPVSAITEASVALHNRYHQRKPVTVKTLLLG